jgi:hypothetical protein
MLKKNAFGMGGLFGRIYADAYMCGICNRGSTLIAIKICHVLYLVPPNIIIIRIDQDSVRVVHRQARPIVNSVPKF